MMKSNRKQIHSHSLELFNAFHLRKSLLLEHSLMAMSSYFIRYKCYDLIVVIVVLSPANFNHAFQFHFDNNQLCVFFLFVCFENHLAYHTDLIVVRIYQNYQISISKNC